MFTRNEQAAFVAGYVSASLACVALILALYLAGALV